MSMLLQIGMVTTLIMISSAQFTKVIDTPSGSLRGIGYHIDNDTVYQFRNIPYAKPPVNALRFMPPKAYGKWSGIRDATVFGPTCMQGDLQPNQTMSEDCLSLNVFAPRNLSGNRSVMIWIHGGGYIKGGASKFEASYLASRGDVVVVTINYRLGVFGFLSTNDSVLPGNNGLRDQQLSMQWVKDNIKSFGGNPSSMTIFGESAGGFSVGLQSIIPQNMGLFQKAIAQSGASPSFVSIAHNPLLFAEDFGRYLKCDFNSTYNFLKCIRAKSAKELLDAQIAVHKPESLTPFPFDPKLSPVVDGDLLPDIPLNLIKNQSSESYRFFRSLDFMAGNVNKEGSLLLNKYLQNFSEIFHFDSNRGVPNTVLCNLLAPSLLTTFFKRVVKNKTISEEICKEYNNSNPEVEGNQIANLYGDVFFLVPSVVALDHHSDGNANTSTFQYIFNRRNPSMKGNGPYPAWFTGAPHASENIFLFGLQELAEKEFVSKEDLDLSRDVQLYWANFAKTGKPAADNAPEWPVYNKRSRSYQNLDVVISQKNNIFEDRVLFWTEKIPIF